MVRGSADRREDRVAVAFVSEMSGEVEMLAPDEELRGSVKSRGSRPTLPRRATEGRAASEA